MLERIEKETDDWAYLVRLWDRWKMQLLERGVKMK